MILAVSVSPCPPPQARAAARLKTLVLAIAACLALASCATLGASRPGLALPPAGLPAWQPVARGIDAARLVSKAPRVEAWALRVDLGAEGLEAVVSQAVDGQALSQYVTSFARSAGCAVAVNAAPFEPSGLVEGEPRTVVGLGVAEGRLVSAPRAPYAALVLRRLSGGGYRAEVALQSGYSALTLEGDPVEAAVGGFFVVLEDGSVLPSKPRREPRTAAGVSRGGRILYLLVADGRRAGSAGLSDEEAGLWLASLGAADGLTLDGGGSSAMALRDAAGQVRIVNRPVNGLLPGSERAVGQCLGFRAPPP